MKNYPYSNSNCSVTNNNTQDCSLNNASMKNMHRSMNRNQLMEHINQVSFAVDEVKLYLDTHPCDSEALAYFHEMSADYSCAERWNWINEPWPWQEGGC